MIVCEDKEKNYRELDLRTLVLGSLLGSQIGILELRTEIVATAKPAGLGGDPRSKAHARISLACTSEKDTIKFAKGLLGGVGD